MEIPRSCPLATKSVVDIPTEPEVPVIPAEPMTPTGPTTPVEPTEPMTPTEPLVPDTPSEPVVDNSWWGTFKSYLAKAGSYVWKF